ncbi:MAG TPA: hypothetical protein DCR93_15275 [Cytophagales bacterium]|nr:hypothetical protein [Cytophagales bacterium]
MFGFHYDIKCSTQFFQNATYLAQVITMLLGFNYVYKLLLCMIAVVVLLLLFMLLLFLTFAFSSLSLG